MVEDATARSMDEGRVAGAGPELEGTTIEHEEKSNAQGPTFQPDFPEGGARAWLVVLGAMIVMGCSFGYLSAFGYVHLLFRECPFTLLLLPSAVRPGLQPTPP